MSPQKNTLVVTLASIVVFLAAIAGTFFLWHRAAANKLERARQAIRGAGLPETLADLVRQPVPDERNAAIPLAEAGRLAKKIPRESPALGGKPQAEVADPASGENEQIEALRAALSTPEAAGTLNFARKGAALPTCDFHLDYSKGVCLDLSPMTSLFQVSKVLAASARLQASHGKPEGALADIEVMLRISAFFGEAPSILSWLMMAGMDKMAIKALTDVVAKCPDLPPNALDRISRLLEEHRTGAAGALLTSLDSERIVFGGSVFEGILSGSTSPALVLKNLSLGSSPASFEEMLLTQLSNLYAMPDSPLLLADYARYLEYMTAMRLSVASPERPLPDVALSITKIPKTAILTRLAAPALGSMGKQLTSYETTLDLAITGIALEKFRMANGTYPASLDELAPLLAHPVPIDPYSGSPLIYKNLPDGLLLYSMGENRADDGGNVLGSAGTRDIVWKIVRPAKSASKQ